MVRLLLVGTHPSPYILKTLSIPQWFDCYQAEIWGFGSKTTRKVLKTAHGRVGTSALVGDPVQAFYILLSPSPHGRVGTFILPDNNFPTIGRRPLMVGSERETATDLLRSELKSPSPHGRVGTCLDLRFAVPSWSGRNRGKS